MAQLPIFQSDSQPMTLLQTRWAGVLNPVLSNPLLDGRLLTDIDLVTGDTTINHGLGRAPRGYLVVAQDAAAAIYQVASTMPNLTLVLNTDADCAVSLWVF